MPRHAQGLRVIVRPDTGALTIVGTVNGERIRRRAQSHNGRLAREEAAALEAELLRAQWHGERRGARPFADAALSYLEAAPRAKKQKDRINRLLRALGDIDLAAVEQQKAIELKCRMLSPAAAPATFTREIIVPLRAILNHAHSLGWCDIPHFVVPRAAEGRTLYLLPHEVERLIGAAVPHLRPLLTFLVGTGARISEAIELEWRDVDLAGARAIFWKTKNAKRRNAELPPVVVAALANLGHREGRVFRWERRRQDGTRRVSDYADHDRQYGGHIKTAWRGAIKRAGLDRDLTPHDLRHTWASWHYARNRDLLRLKIEGGWSSVALVERYAHLLPAGHEAAIRGFWHGSGTALGGDVASA